MLLSFLRGLPLWVTIPGYLMVGFVWAVLFLPRALQEQADAYRAWRDGVLGGRPLREVLGSEQTVSHGSLVTCTPDDFLIWRDRAGGLARFSPQKIIQGFILDLAFWPYRVVHKLVFVYLRSAWRAFCRMCRYVWRHGVVAFCQWVYQGVTKIYQVIISRANRDAIADQAFLSQETKKEPGRE